MKNTAKKSALAISFAVIAAVSPTAAFADQYGGSNQNTSIRLNKMVQNPETGSFEDDLSVSEHNFRAGDEIVYRVNVTNNGDTSFGFVDVTDTLPSFLEFVSGPGNYNSGNRHVTYRLENLTPGKTETRDIKVKVVSADRLPSDKGTFCVVNAASLKTNDDRSASDTAQACISNKVKTPKVPIKELPATGSTEVAFGLLAIGAIGTGMVLRKAQ